MKSFRTFLIEAEVLQKDKILLFLSKNKDKDPRIAKLLNLFKNGKLSERQIKAISDSIERGTFKKIEKVKQRGEDRRKGPEERRAEGNRNERRAVDGRNERRGRERREDERRGDERRNLFPDHKELNVDTQTGLENFDEYTDEETGEVVWPIENERRKEPIDNEWEESRRYDDRRSTSDPFYGGKNRRSRERRGEYGVLDQRENEPNRRIGRERRIAGKRTDNKK